MGLIRDTRPSACGICFRGCRGLIYKDPKDENAKAIGACSMEHLELLKEGERGELQTNQAFIVHDDCKDYAIEQAKPFIKEHGPHLNKWDKQTVSKFISLIIKAYKTKENQVPF